MGPRELDGDGGREESVWTGRTWAVGRAEPAGPLEPSGKGQDWSLSKAPPGASGPDKSEHRYKSLCTPLHQPSLHPFICTCEVQCLAQGLLNNCGGGSGIQSPTTGAKCVCKEEEEEEDEWGGLTSVDVFGPVQGGVTVKWRPGGAGGAGAARGAAVGGAGVNVRRRVDIHPQLP